MQRPGIGTKGSPIELQINAFNVKTYTDAIVYHYDVAITPDVPGAVKRDLWKYAEQTPPLTNYKTAYDGQKNCYLLSLIPGDEPISFEVNLPEDGRKTDGRTFLVSMKLAGKINLAELVHFFSIKNAEISNNMADAIVALNVMIRHRAALQFPSKGASIYPTPSREFPNSRFPISGGVEMWRGYFSSLRFSPQGLVLNINSTVMPFIQEGNLLEVAAKFLDPRGGKDELIRHGLQERDYIKLDRFLRGCKVSITRTGNANAPQISGKIRGIGRQPAERHTFTMDDGSTTNVADYFKTHYNKSIMGRKLPCVQLTKKAFFPLELCTVRLGTKFSKKLNPQQVADVLKFTTQKPRDRLNSVRDGLKRLEYGKCDTVRAWNFSVDPNPITVKARKLANPVLQFGTPGRNQPKTVTPRDATWRYDRDTGFLSPATVNSWLVLVFQNPKVYSREKVQESIRMLMQACKNTGMRFNDEKPAIHHINPSKTQTPQELFNEMRSLCKDKPSLIVTYVPVKNNPMYPIIKVTGDIISGIPTQNLVIQKTYNAKPAYYANVALKINVKMGGRNFRIANEFPGVGSDPVMVVGADVTHPGPGSTKPSVAGVVASHEGSACGYSSVVRVQSSRQEYIADLQEMMAELLRKYNEYARVKPQRIFFYRDGVSEGMFADVLAREVPAIKKAYEIFSDPNYAPLLTFIICGKRHHYRFFPTTGGDRNGNAPAGTIVDTGIVHPTDYDWYLLSHNGLLGTSRPAHYSVLFDENKLSTDDMQAFTFNLCFLYPRSTRSVSIASPAYFAHHVCTRARTHIGMSEGDDDTLSRKSEEEAAEAQKALVDATAQLKPIHKALADRMYFM